jgi:hypothetical protein
MRAFMHSPHDPLASRAELLRRRVTRATRHGTRLIADLQALAEGFELLLPELADATERERWAEVARVAGLDPAMPTHLADLVEALADVLAGLRSDDGGTAWLGHQRARLAAGEDAAAA